MKIDDTMLLEGGISSLFGKIRDFTSEVGKDITSVAKTASDNPAYKDAKSKRSNQYLGGSISNYSKDLIMSFPIMCDDSLPPSTASMISRANERNIVTMLEMLFASMQFNGTNGKEILSLIHKNIKVGYTIDDAIDELENWIDTKSVKETVTQQQTAIQVKMMLEQLRTPQKSFPINSFSENSLNDFLVYNIGNRMVIREYYNPKTPQDIAREIRKDRYEYNKDKRDEKRDAREERKAEYDQNKEMRDAQKYGADYENINRRNLDIEIGNMQRQLLDSDVKKANEMQPTLMIVKFNEFDPNGQYMNQGKSFIAGVKSRLIPVEPMDIAERLIAKKKTQLNFLNFIRATTGEIHLVKDLLLCIDQAKLDSKNEVKKGPSAKMWRVLEDRGIKNNKNKLKKSGNDASAITTLVLNQETVNFMKKQYDFDIEMIRNAKMIMEIYNFIGIIIADESIEVVKYLYAGNDLYEQQAYSFIEKETNDNSYKKVINLLGKSNNGR